MEKIKEYLKIIDFFGHNPSFIIKNNLKYKTHIGGLLTLIVIIISVITLIFFSEELYSKKSPSVNLITEANLNPSKINFFDNFEFIIGIQNDNFIVQRNESIYYAKGFLFQTIINSSGIFNIKEEIDLDSCDKALKNSINYELFKDLNLNNYYCFSKNQSKININNIYLNEYWGNNGFQMLQIKFYDCVNTDEYVIKNNITCASEEILKENLNLADLSLYFIDTFISTNNYKNPFQRGIHEYFYDVSKNFLLTLTQYYNHIEINDDSGLIFTTSNKINSFKLSDMVTNKADERTGEHFLTLTLQLNNIIEKYQRKYYKLQDYAAQVGGVINTLIIICYFILKFYDENAYFEFLINEYFEIKLFEKKKTESNISFLENNEINNNVNKNINKKKEKNKLKNFKENPSNLNGSKKNNYQKNKNGSFINNLIKSKKKINLSFCDKFFFIQFCQKKSRAKKNGILEVYLLAKNHLMNYMDILGYLKHLFSEDQKHKLLLNEDQQKIFDYIFKPILSHNYIGTRYNGQNLPTKIKEKLFGEKKIRAITKKINNSLKEKTIELKNEKNENSIIQTNDEKIFSSES